MNRYLTIGQTAEILGVSIQTLRNWDKSGLLIPDKKTQGGARRYSYETLSIFKRNSYSNNENRLTIAYARVANKNQIVDLARQIEVLDKYCAQQGYEYKLIQEVGSGLNFYKKGLKELCAYIAQGKVKRLILTHKDRLLRYGAEIIFSLCEANGVELLFINNGNENMSFEEDEIKDLQEALKVCDTSDIRIAIGAGR